jgi:peroxiredoxin
MVSMKNMKSFLRLMPVIFLLAGILTLAACSAGNTPVKMDSPAPDFTLKDLDGKSVSLNSFRGKVVFINFWDTTFDAALEQMPYLQELYSDWSKQGAVVLLTIDIEEDAPTVKTFMEKHKYTFPVLLDSKQEVAEKYSIQYIPTSLLIDKNGKLQLNIVGPFKDKDAIEKQVASFLP